MTPSDIYNLLLETPGKKLTIAALSRWPANRLRTKLSNMHQEFLAASLAPVGTSLCADWNAATEQLTVWIGQRRNRPKEFFLLDEHPPRAEVAGAELLETVGAHSSSDSSGDNQMSNFSATASDSPNLQVQESGESSASRS